ncbi:MAG: glycosyltransferase family 39 protein [Gemmatimonadota bacterium]
MRALWLLALAVGVAARLIPWLRGRSFRLDEASLLLNLMARGYAGLAEPLAFNQAAPPGFLIVEKALYGFFGVSELGLRSFPCLAGVAALVAFMVLSRRLLSRSAALYASWCFAVAPPLVRWSSDLKPYSLDVLVVCLLTLGLAEAERRRSMPAVAVFGVLAAVGVWFSYPASFVTAGFGSWLLYRSRRSWDSGPSTATVAGILLIPVLSFAVHFVALLRPVLGNASLVEYWSDGFAPVVPSSARDLYWYLDASIETIRASLDFAVGSVDANAVGLGLFLVGLFSLLRRPDGIGAAFLLTVAATLAASSLEKWPYTGRMLLFLAPLMALGIGEGAREVSAHLTASARRVFLVGAVALLVPPLAQSTLAMSPEGGYEEIGPVMEYASRRRTPRQRILVYYGARNAYSVYADRIGLPMPAGGPRARAVAPAATAGIPPGSVHFSSQHRGDWTAYRRELAGVVDEGEWWVIFSHVYTWGDVDEKKLFRWLLEDRGEVTDSIVRPGASAYLYSIGEGAGRR